MNIAKLILCNLLNIHKRPGVEWVEDRISRGTCPRCLKEVYTCICFKEWKEWKEDEYNKR